MNSKLTLTAAVALAIASGSEIANADHNEGFCVRASAPITFNRQMVIPGEFGTITDLLIPNSVAVIWYKTYDAGGKERNPNYNVLQADAKPAALEVSPCPKHVSHTPSINGGTWIDPLDVPPVFPDNRPAPIYLQQ